MLAQALGRDPAQPTVAPHISATHISMSALSLWRAQQAAGKDGLTSQAVVLHQDECRILPLAHPRRQAP